METAIHDQRAGRPAFDPSPARALRDLRNFHYLVLFGSLALTIAIWNYANTASERQARINFDYAADQVLELIGERMKSYEDGLRAGVGAINANGGDIGLKAWRTFARTLQIDRRYSGINGIGVIFNVPQAEMQEFLSEQRILRPDFALHPAHEKGVNLPITYIEPEAPNAQAVGLDMAFEENRHSGLLAARDTGDARITGPIILVQDAGATPGFLFFAPFYSMPGPKSVADRRRSFAGAVYAPFVMKKLMQGVLDRDKRQVWVAISDGETTLYDEHRAEEAGQDPDPLFARTLEMEMYGRTWTIDLRSNPAFRAANISAQPTIILVCGLTIDALLLLLFASMARSNHRAIAYADEVTHALQQEKRELLATNAALEQFSYIASHDLKTPIRGMRDATGYLMEDLGDRHPDTLKDRDILDQFNELKSLNDRMEALVKGVLECAQIPHHAPPTDPHNPRDIILAHARDLRLRPEELRLEGIFPDLLMSKTSLSQIFGNLLCNAVAHGAGEALRITVSAHMTADGAEFTVTDKGPGIEPRFHAKIFEMFQSLEKRGPAKSTGIGLAIVRKAVESVHGTVRVESRPGTGARFVIHLPNAVVLRASDIAAE